MIGATNPERRSFSPGAWFTPLTWLFAIAAVAIAFTPILPELLEFDAPAIRGGELWRFLTGHFTHWNLDHLCWDLSVFVVLGALCERRGRGAFLACVLGSAGAISLYALLALPELPVYRGLSGIDTGLFALLAVGLFADARARGNRGVQRLIAAAVMSLVVKTLFEFTTGGTLFVDHAEAAFVPVTMAHVLGAVVGLAVGLSVVASDRRRLPADTASVGRPMASDQVSPEATLTAG